MEYVQFSPLLPNSRLTSCTCQTTRLSQAIGATRGPSLPHAFLSISVLLWGVLGPWCILLGLILLSNFKLTFNQSLSFMYAHIFLNFLFQFLFCHSRNFLHCSSLFNFFSFTSFYLLFLSLSFFLFILHYNIIYIKYILSSRNLLSKF